MEKCAQGLRRWGNDPAWRWKFTLERAEILITSEKPDEARKHLESLAGAPASAELQARWKLDLANVLAQRTRAVEASALLEEASRLASQARANTLLCQIELRRAMLEKDFQPGEARGRAALQLAQKEQDAFLVSSALIYLGYNRLRMSRYDEAIPYLEQARTIAEQLGARANLQAILGNLGWCRYSLGDADHALPLFKTAEALAKELGESDYQHRWLGALGLISCDKGDIPAALLFHQQAAELSRQARNETWLAIALNNLAETALAANDPDRAEQFNAQALAIKRRKENERSLIYSELNQARINVLRHRTQEAEARFHGVIAAAREVQEPLVLWTAYAELASLYRATKRTEPAERNYRNAINTIDAEWSKLGQQYSKFTFLAHLIGFYKNYVEFLLENGDAGKALEVAESSRARVLRQRLEGSGVAFDNLNLPGLTQIAKGTGTVMLSYWLGPRRSSVWAIGPAGTHQVDLPPQREIETLVEQYDKLIQAGVDPAREDRPVAARLEQAVLAPVRGLIPHGGKVIIVPDGQLHQLNFETLVIREPRPHYWIEDVSVAVAPSLGVIRRAAARRQAPRLLFLGDPAPAAAEFPPLPHLKKEVEVVSRNFAAASRVVWTGAQAYPERYQQARPQDFTTIHFAAHATANRDSPLNSAIILAPTGSEHIEPRPRNGPYPASGSGYKLYAKDVAGLPLRADLVTISACRSAGARTYSGEGLIGFSWAFLQAGARHVIAGLWDVDDAATVEIMTHLYQQIAGGSSAGEALRAAKLRLVASTSHCRPYYWGPFQVFTYTR